MKFLCLTISVLSLFASCVKKLTLFSVINKFLFFFFSQNQIMICYGLKGVTDFETMILIFFTLFFKFSYLKIIKKFDFFYFMF